MYVEDSNRQPFLAFYFLNRSPQYLTIFSAGQPWPHSMRSCVMQAWGPANSTASHTCILFVINFSCHV